MARFRLFRLSLVLPLVLLAACREPKVTTYAVPKEADPTLPMGDASSGSGDMASTSVDTAAGPGLTWTAPASWQAKPLSAMRKGSYAVPGPGGAAADLSITAFPGDVGGELANVNRWRGQVQLPPVDDAGLSAVVQRGSENGLAMTVVDFSSPGGGPSILGAIVPFGGGTWFFKLMGPEAVVAQAKPGFLAFLKTVKPSAQP